MISLKRYLDELAGPDHAFTKGVLMEGPAGAAEKKELETAEVEPRQRALNQFLRVNQN